MGYNGIVAEIPVGYGGLTGSKNQAKIRPDQLVAATNISYETGNISKEGGAAKYNTTQIAFTTNGIIGGHDWWPSDGVQRMIIAVDLGGANSVISRDEGVGDFAFTMASGLTLTGTMPYFVEGGKEVAANNRKLFIFTGPNPVQVINGDAAVTNNLTTPPADWSSTHHAKFGLIHENRLWGGGNTNDPHRLYYSTATNHEDFTGAGSGSISVYPGEGEKLVGAMSFKGLIIAYKFPVGIYLVDTSDPTPGNWRVKPLTRAIGGLSPRCAIPIDDDVLFVDSGGNFQLVSAVTEFGDMGNRNLSAEAQIGALMRANINFGQLTKVQGVYYSHKREAHFILPAIGSTECDRRMVCDFNGQAPRFRLSDRDDNNCIWMRKDSNNIQRPVIGTPDGFIYKLDQDTKSKDGLAYASSFQTAHMDFSWLDPKLATKRKHGQFLELVVEPTGDWNLTVDILWDNVVKQTVQFNMGSTGVTLGTFVLGTDKLGGGAVLNKKRRITGSGRRLSLVGRNNGAGEDFSVSRFLLHFKVSDERLEE